jgi:20S proteasome alpha/beta subunit
MSLLGGTPVTLVIGIKCTDGVLLVSDSSVTMDDKAGIPTARTTCTKLIEINGWLVGCAGEESAIQACSDGLFQPEPPLLANAKIALTGASRLLKNHLDKP